MRFFGLSLEEEEALDRELGIPLTYLVDATLRFTLYYQQGKFQLAWQEARALSTAQPELLLGPVMEALACANIPGEKGNVANLCRRAAQVSTEHPERNQHLLVFLCTPEEIVRPRAHQCLRQRMAGELWSLESLAGSEGNQAWELMRRDIPTQSFLVRSAVAAAYQMVEGL
jgi:hypothetical protein